jgi:hypothetical protein
MKSVSPFWLASVKVENSVEKPSSLAYVVRASMTAGASPSRREIGSSGRGSPSVWEMSKT